MPEVHVCHAGTCRAAGAEGVLLEIEELASAVGEACKVRESGCLGYCNQAPNVLINRRTIQTRVTSLEKSAGPQSTRGRRMASRRTQGSSGGFVGNRR